MVAQEGNLIRRRSGQKKTGGSGGTGKKKEGKIETANRWENAHVDVEHKRNPGKGKQKKRGK